MLRQTNKAKPAIAFTARHSGLQGSDLPLAGDRRRSDQICSGGACYIRPIKSTPCAPGQGCTGVANTGTVTVGGNFSTGGALAIDNLTAGSIPFAASGRITQDNAALFWDDGAGRLAVGHTEFSCASSLCGQYEFGNNTDNSGVSANATVLVSPLAVGTSGAGYHVISSSPQLGNAFNAALGAYDARVYLAPGNAQAISELGSYQSYPLLSGSAGPANWRAFLSGGQISGTYAIPNWYGFQVNAPTLNGAGVAPLTTYGLYVAQDTLGSVANWAVYTQGNTPSYFGGTVDFADGSALSSTGLAGSLSHTITPTPVVGPVAVDQSQATGGTVTLAFANTTGVAAGQAVSGVNVPLGDTVISTVATAQQALTGSGTLSASGQKIVTTTSTTGCAAGEQLADVTTPGAIGAGNLVASVQAGVSVTVTSNLLTNTGASDTYHCDPVVTLAVATSAAVTSATGNISFLANHTAISVASAFYDQGDASINGNLNVGPKLSVGAAGATHPVIIGNLSNAPTYGALSFNGLFGSNTMEGIYAGSVNDPNSLNFTTTGGAVTFNSNGSPIGSIDGVGDLTVVKTITAAALSTAGTIAGSICATSAGLILYESGASSCTISLEELKRDIESLSLFEAFGDVMRFNPIAFNFKDEVLGRPAPRQFGLGARQVANIDGRLSTVDGQGELQGWDPNGVLAVTIRVVQAIQYQVAALWAIVLILLIAVGDLYRRNRKLAAMK